MRQTTEVGEIFKTMAKRKWIIIIITSIFMILGILYSFFIASPVYKAETTIIVSSAKDKDSNLDISNINVNQTIAVTYGVIIKSRAVLETVIDELNLDTNYEKFSPKVSSEPVGNTEVIVISVKDNDRKKAVIIADKITEVFRKEAIRILKVNNIEIIDSAAATEGTVNRSPLMNIILLTMAGLVFSVIIALIVDYRDNTLKTEEDVEKYLQLPLIGSVPNFKTLE